MKKVKRMRALKKPQNPPQPRDEIDRDQFEVIGPQLKGRAYQWVTISIYGDKAAAKHHLDYMKASGWKPVPARRHPKMPHSKGQIIVGGQVLMDRSARREKLARQADLAAAQKLAGEREPNGTSRVGSSTFPSKDAPAATTSDGENLSDRHEKAKEDFRNRDGVIPVTIGIALTDRQVEAAAIVNQTLDEYASYAVRSGVCFGDGPLALIEVRQGVFRFAEFKVSIVP